MGFIIEWSKEGKGGGCKICNNCIVDIVSRASRYTNVIVVLHRHNYTSAAGSNPLP